MSQTSVNPAGESFSLPAESDYPAEFERLSRLVQEACQNGQEIVVVMGVGFVGAVMAAIIADSTDERGKPWFEA